MFVAPLAVFAAEHFVPARSIEQMVPVWMPARLFWTYFVGCALIAGATSLVAMKFVRLSATLLGVMFLLFVLMLRLPNAIAHPGDRLAWTFGAERDSFRPRHVGPCRQPEPEVACRKAELDDPD